MEAGRYFCVRLSMCLWVISFLIVHINTEGCPPSEAILPCRCSLRNKEMQIWCSHSNLPQIISGMKAVERNVKGAIDELVLENNQLPALPGRFFGTLQIIRLMLRYNSIERVSNGWLNELENSLVEIYIVEPQLRSIPDESLNGMINMVAITIQSDELKHLPNFSELLSMTYLSVQSKSLVELQIPLFRHLPKVQNIHINGGPSLNRLEAGLFDGLISLKNIDLSHNGINWIHLRAFSRLSNVVTLKLSHNDISDAGMVGRIIKDLEHLKKLRLDHNLISIVADGSFVDLAHLSELHLNDNRIMEIQYGAFLRILGLKTIYLHNNLIKNIHPESFLQASGSGVETVYIYNNEIEHVGVLRSLLDALPALKFLDISNNYITSIPYGELRGHGTLEQLHLNNNLLRTIDRDAFMAMPALRELRMHNNSLSNDLPKPFWNLPGLKGLDLSNNQFHIVESSLLSGLPSLRRLDLSRNGLSIIEPTAFMHNPMLETLNISGNELVTIHPATLRSLHHLFEVDVSHNKLTEIIPGLPKIVERISLRGNFITSLPVPASKALNLYNLRMLDLSWNMLDHLPKYVFQGATQLRVLSLAKNRLRVLDDTTFIGARRLELLHLQDNALSHIDERTFLCMPELKNLNLQGNKLETITDNMFSNNSHLEQLDLSRNNIHSISTAAFENQRSLEYLDLSGNVLTDISVSLSNLINLQDFDMSYNKVSKVHADVVSAWQNVVEIRLSNNAITSLSHGTFRNLPKLQYLDLSSNEIKSVEPGALRNLPDLQELVLADNKLIELKDNVFEDLPNLLASHFQFNMLQYISPESFYNTPSMVFLNLSNNNFHNMENIGLRTMRNLEVLDLSTNGVKSVSTMPLRSLSWLVELKLDNNQICKIQGSPFDSMPRLRVLSIRNNRLRSIQERSFRNLRGNIAVLDVDGNPITCSCEMQWFSVWLQETNFPYPGPKCQDGRLLRASRIDKNLCLGNNNTNQRTDSDTVKSFDSVRPNILPLLNEHGDIFQRELIEELNQDCDALDAAPVERPFPGESEYFYDQYIDYTPTNEDSSVSTQPPPGAQLESSNTILSHQKPPTISSNIDLNNTILNTNYFIKRPGQISPQTMSPFTFFGYPISGFSLGRFFGTGSTGRKYRGEKMSTTTKTRQTLPEMPATHRSMHSSSSRGKVRMFQPNGAEFEKYLKHESQRESQYNDVTARNGAMESGSDEAASNEVSKSVFRTTAFREPLNVEHGGFRPIVPDHISGFTPVHNPQSRRRNEESISNITSSTSSNHSNILSERNYIPGEKLMPIEYTRNKPEASQKDSAIALQSTSPTNDVIESQTYYVTESYSDTTESGQMTTDMLGVMNNADATASTSISKTTTDNKRFDSEFYDDLDGQSVEMLKPPPMHTTTAETILLIPPPEEHLEQIMGHSWIIKNKDKAEIAMASSTTTTTKTVPSMQSIPRPAGGRSTITKVFTPLTLSKYLPTAEEYYRSTTTEQALDTKADYIDSISASSKRIIPDAQKRDNNVQERVVNAASSQRDLSDRKDGMDWYYDSFNMIHTSGSNYERSRHLPASGDSWHSVASSCNRNGFQCKFVEYLWTLVAFMRFSQTFLFFLRRRL